MVDCSTADPRSQVPLGGTYASLKGLDRMKIDKALYKRSISIDGAQYLLRSASELKDFRLVYRSAASSLPLLSGCIYKRLALPGEGRTTEPACIDDEDLRSDGDIYVSMPPKRAFDIILKIEEIERAEPRIDEY